MWYTLRFHLLSERVRALDVTAFVAIKNKITAKLDQDDDFFFFLNGSCNPKLKTVAGERS